MTEHWRPIPGYEGQYQVSDQGRVRSLPRRDGRGHRISGRILAGAPDSGGYLTYNLWTEGRGRTHRGHALVMLAFVGPPPDGLEVRHLNGDSTDNTLTNLAYGTPSENAFDRVRHGTHHGVKKTHCKYGHPLDGTTRHGDRSQRYCLTCHRERSIKALRAAGIGPRQPKTHCPRGHPYTPENTYIAPKRGSRNCRACRGIATKTYQQEQSPCQLS